MTIKPIEYKESCSPILKVSDMKIGDTAWIDSPNGGVMLALKTYNAIVNLNSPNLTWDSNEGIKHYKVVRMVNLEMKEV